MVDVKSVQLKPKKSSWNELNPNKKSFGWIYEPAGINWMSLVRISLTCESFRKKGNQTVFYLPILLPKLLFGVKWNEKHTYSTLETEKHKLNFAFTSTAT